VVAYDLQIICVEKMMRRIYTEDVNALVMVKGVERYVFLFTDENRSEVLRTIGRFASSPELSLTWYDAADLTRKVREVTS
jgi:hypothetical protein